MEKNMMIPKSVVRCADAMVAIMKNSDKKLHEIFEDFIIEVKEKIFEGPHTFCPICFFMFRDYELNTWKAGCYPMLPTNIDGSSPVTMAMHAASLKKIIPEMKTAEQNNFKLVGVLTVMDSFMKAYDRAEVIKKDGILDKTKVIRPSKDPNSLNVLQFDLEEIFVKHSICYQYITSEDGGCVINPKPIYDHKRPYSEIENKNSNFGFLFTEGTQMN